MRLILPAIFGVCIVFVCGKHCRDLTGAWRDDLGSNMTIEMIAGSQRFTGKFTTAVESTAGAQTIASQVSGLMLPQGDGSLVAFNVIFSDGQNLASWAGECLECDGEERLYTTFLLRFQEAPGRAWTSTIINRNLFCRPPDADQVGAQLAGMVSDLGLNAENEGLSGKYISETGDSFEIKKSSDTGCWEGEHKGSPLYGILDGDGHSYAAMGFVSDAGKKRIQSWAGLIDEVSGDQTLMQTAWIKHTFSNNCKNPFKNVNYGMDNYTQSVEK